MAIRTGVAKLPLHYGVAPRWLVSRMRRLAKPIVAAIVDEYGTEEIIKRISNPYWFQALGCTLGYDWHSSGLTTVTTGVLKTVIDGDETGLAVAGGKGKRSRMAPSEIEEIASAFGFSTARTESLSYASRMCAKVDSAAIQAGYPLYHHAFFVSEKGTWAVIQQGMDTREHMARRYHWLSSDVKSYVVEPHSAVVCDVRREVALDMTAMESESCRRTCTDLSKEKPGVVMRMLRSIRPKHQRSLLDYFPTVGEKEREFVIDALYMPRNLNWSAVQRAYEFQPKNYEQLLSMKGIGPATVRGLALISDLVYGDPPSWRDPVRFSFTVGGKDGVPFPIKREEMDRLIEILEKGIREARLGDREKISAVKRLRNLIAGWTDRSGG